MIIGGHRSRGRSALEHSSPSKKICDIFPLCKRETLLVGRNLNTKKVMKSTQILNGKLFMEPSNQAIHNIRGGADHNYIINVDQKVYGDLRATKNKQRSVCRRCHKTMSRENRAKVMMPYPRCLFKTIEGHVKLTQMVRMLRILKSRWLAHKHLFLKNTMEKGILDIKLTNSPSSSNC